MTETEKHLQTIATMKCQHSHIRKNDAEWAAMEAAEDAIRRTAEHDKARQEGRLTILNPPAKEGDPKPDCFEERVGSLWCLGRQCSEQDDEPTDLCMQCWYCESGVYAEDDREAALGGGDGG